MNSVEASPSSKVTGRRLGLGIALTLVGGIGWGFSGTCAQLLFANPAYGVTPQWLVCVRTVLAGAFFLAIALIGDRKRLKEALGTPKGLGMLFVFGVFGVLLCQICYLNAIQASNAGTATVLQSLNLLIIMAVVCLRLHRRPTVKECVGVGLAVAGTYLVSTHGSLSGLAISPEALGWGLATAVAAALYTLLPGKLLAQYGSLVTTGVAMAMGGAVSCMLFRPWTVCVQLDFEGVAVLAGVVVIGTIVSFLCFLNGVKLVGSMLAGLLGCVEPMAACVLSAAWLGTVFAPLDIAGMVMIIAMMVLMSLG